MLTVKDVIGKNENLGRLSLEEEGTWIVFGEDVNPDYGGSHYTPILGFFQGKLENVIQAAIKLKEFETWGRGGRIEKIEIKSV